MDRHGNLKISEILEEFSTSKVTLRKHFINKVGLTPKKVSQIWRMNRVLQLKEDYPSLNLTALCLDAGFYDQAHFIKDFRLSFGLAPKKLFSQNSNLIKIANLNISKRFSNQYDPRI
jgi:methylphosphotriester-DNA--protein-cysteine methyltransferase